MQLVNFSLNLMFGPVSDDFVIFCSFPGGVEFRLPNLTEIGCKLAFYSLALSLGKRVAIVFPGFDQYDKGQEMFAFLRHLMRSGSALVKPLLLRRNKEL